MGRGKSKKTGSTNKRGKPQTGKSHKAAREHRGGLHHFIDKHYVDAAMLFADSSMRGKKRVMVYVEGYDDIAFWRGVLSAYETESLIFEINVPTRRDLAKGKRVLLSMVDNMGDSLIACMDSDFDYLFQGYTQQSKQVLSSPYIIHTYTYSIENHLCYAPSLKNLSVKCSKNDMNLFDFGLFFEEYSKAIYPLFLWYGYSARETKTHILVMADFKATIRLAFLDLPDNGSATIDWLRANVAQKIKYLEATYPSHVSGVEHFEKMITPLGVTPKNCYQYMHGHTLFDATSTVLQAVVELLRGVKLSTIKSSSRKGVSLDNEISNYKNSLQSVDGVLRANENFKKSEPFKKLENDIKNLVDRIVR